MAQREESVIDYIEIGVQLIHLAAKLAPSLAAWLGGVIEGRTDSLSTRVRDVLPDVSRSRLAQRELEGP